MSVSDYIKAAISFEPNSGRTVAYGAEGWRGGRAQLRFRGGLKNGSSLFPSVESREVALPQQTLHYAHKQNARQCLSSHFRPQNWQRMRMLKCETFLSRVAEKDMGIS